MFTKYVFRVHGYSTKLKKKLYLSVTINRRHLISTALHLHLLSGMLLLAGECEMSGTEQTRLA